MIKQISSLPEKEQKHFYNLLAFKLFEVFAFDYYEHEEDLQNDFHEWKMSDIRDFRETLDNILNDIAPDMDLTWRDCKKLTKSRFKLCSHCGKPFISYSKKNKMKYCYKKEYTRYKTGNQSNSGYFFTASGNTSLCFMLSERDRQKSYRSTAS